MTEARGRFKKDEKKQEWQQRMNCFMAYSMMWAYGGSYETETQKFKIDNIMQSEFTKAKFSGSESCFN